MQTELSQKTITIIGAGLVGSLLAIYCARRGMKVQLFERRTDPRIKLKLGTVGEGRSINLAISKRGIDALTRLGIEKEVLEEAIPMPGRMMHSPNGELTYQAYGQTDADCINSISRGWLNCFLLDKAAVMPGVEIHFEQKIQAVDLDQKSFTLVESAAHKERKIFYERLIGTDGSASAVRKSLHKKTNFQMTEDELSHGYKEFVMPAKAPGQHKIEKNALHIWPRGSHMMIALPNKDGSYTCTLFLANSEKTAADHFDKLKTPDDVKEFFTKNYADFCDLVPDYVEQYFEHPQAKMATLKCDQWFYKDSVLLMGDASHAIVPFFGQGMNCGFEDVVAFDRLLGTSSSWSELFQDFFAKRKTNADAIADMAVENFTEMSSKTADPKFLYQKKVEKRLQDTFPEDYQSRYTMVSFSLTPYRMAYQAGLAQAEILNSITEKYYPQTDFPLEEWRAPIHNQLGPIMKQIKEQLAKETSWT